MVYSMTKSEPLWYPDEILVDAYGQQALFVGNAVERFCKQNCRITATRSLCARCPA